jgi:hypothetical protein
MVGDVSLDAKRNAMKPALKEHRDIGVHPASMQVNGGRLRLGLCIGPHDLLA